MKPEILTGIKVLSAITAAAAITYNIYKYEGYPEVEQNSKIIYQKSIVSAKEEISAFSIDPPILLIDKIITFSGKKTFREINSESYNKFNKGDSAIVKYKETYTIQYADKDNNGVKEVDTLNIERHLISAEKK